MNGVRVIQTPFYEAITNDNAKTMFIILNSNEDALVSDADANRVPPQRPSTRDANGRIDYYERAEPGIDRMWREKLGKYLYDHVVRPDLRKEGIHLKEKPNKIYLISFPSHYTLWVHKKGDPHDPRKDSYLYGSRNVAVFRSPNEFYPHLEWILEGQPMQGGKPDCRCCWCDPSQTQGKISEALGTYHPYRRDGDGKGGKRGGSGGKPGGKPSGTMSTTIPFKDYTKLNNL